MSWLAEVAALVVLVDQARHINAFSDHLLPFYISFVALVFLAFFLRGRPKEKDVLLEITKQKLLQRAKSYAPVQQEIVDYSMKPDMSGHFKRVSVDFEDELMAAQGVPYMVRIVAAVGDLYQRLLQSNEGMQVTQIKSTRTVTMEYFYNQKITEPPPFGEGHDEVEIFWEDDNFVVSKYNPVTQVRFLGTRNLQDDGNTIHSYAHIWTKASREGDYYKPYRRHETKGPEFATHIISTQIFVRHPEEE